LTLTTARIEDGAVADSIQTAPTGRAKCKGCGSAIGKGELRFGETGPNSYGEGEATSWFHLTCAALMRPEKLEPVLASYSEALPEREWLKEAVRLGALHPRLPRILRAETASSGRSTCRSCRELIGKGEWRFVLQTFEDMRANPIGNIHVSCAEAYFGTLEQVLERAERLTPALSEADLKQLRQALSEQRPGLAKAPAADADDTSKVSSGSA
jgi:hypothetical protein